MFGDSVQDVLQQCLVSPQSTGLRFLSAKSRTDSGGYDSGAIKARSDASSPTAATGQPPFGQIIGRPFAQSGHSGAK
jgi:hypothetical protein